MFSLKLPSSYKQAYSYLLHTEDCILYPDLRYFDTIITISHKICIMKKTAVLLLKIIKVARICIHTCVYRYVCVCVCV